MEMGKYKGVGSTLRMGFFFFPFRSVDYGYCKNGLWVMSVPDLEFF